MADPDDVPLNVRLPRELHRRMKMRALLRGQTIREYVRSVIAEAVDRDETEDRKAGRG